VWRFAHSCDTAWVTRYFEDYVQGVTVDCGSVQVDAASIIEFAKNYDPQPFHTDPDIDGPYGGLIASGWHTVSLAMRQVVDAYLSPESSLGGSGVDELRWPAPVRPGDTLRFRVTVLSARKSESKPDRGIIRTLVEGVNQNDVTILTLNVVNFIRVRPIAT
jgi:acyl dehydratase